jgi:hypothetical protein
MCEDTAFFLAKNLKKMKKSPSCNYSPNEKNVFENDMQFISENNVFSESCGKVSLNFSNFFINSEEEKVLEKGRLDLCISIASAVNSSLGALGFDNKKLSEFLSCLKNDSCNSDNNETNISGNCSSITRNDPLLPKLIECILLGVSFHHSGLTQVFFFFIQKSVHLLGYSFIC